MGTGAPFMMDVVVLALMVLVPLLFYSIRQVKPGNPILHKRLQLLMAAILLLAVILFEIEVRLAGGIYELTNNSLYYKTRFFDIMLYTHLVFAISTPFLWAWTIAGALRHFKNGSMGVYAEMHKKLGWLSAMDLVCTSATGIWVYYISFIAVRF